MNQLSDKKIIATIMGGEMSANFEEVAGNLLKEYTMLDLASFSTDRWMQEKGVGRTKALQLSAAFALAARISAPIKDRPKITSSRDAYEVFISRTSMRHIQHEECWVLYLNRKNVVIACEMISQGGTYGTIVDSRIIYHRAIEKRAAFVILAHNHPSGATEPSHADIALTNRVVGAGKILDIRLLDHIIVSETGYYSFTDEGKIDAV